MRIVRLSAITAAVLTGAMMSAASAGPVATESEGVRGAPQSLADETEAAATTPPVSGHKTIDLLLQLQPDARGTTEPLATAPKSSAVPRATPTQATPAPDPTMLDQLKEVMLSSGVRQVLGSQAPDPAREARIADERQRRELQFGVRDEPRGSPGATAGGTAGGSLLDLTVIRFIRENRWLVITGSVAVLALAYGAANFTYHRRRR